MTDRSSARTGRRSVSTSRPVGFDVAAYLPPAVEATYSVVGSELFRRNTI